jgi:CBS-domain-containing membrane protein
MIGPRGLAAASLLGATCVLGYAVSSRPLAAPAVDEITDPAMLAAFAAKINAAGFYCPRVVTLKRLPFETALGLPFVVGCTTPPRGAIFTVTIGARTSVTLDRAL